MPSSALLKFETNMLVDVDRTISSHGKLNHDGMGRRGLGHITRDGVLTLCAAWELYLEELAVETGKIYIEKVDSPDQLPKPVQKEIAKVFIDCVGVQIFGTELPQKVTKNLNLSIPMCSDSV